MSNHIQATPTPAGVVHAPIGGSAASADLVAECRMLEKLCGELQVERERLREELAETQNERDRYRRTVYHFMSKDSPPPTFTKEEALALVGQAPPLEEFIAELEREMRSGA